MKLTWARAACSHPALSGVSRAHFGELLEELASPWASARESVLRDQRGGPRRRSVGSGRKPKLVFVDRLLVTLIHLRHGLPHVVLAEFFNVDLSTVSAAIRQVRPLLAARGFAVPDRPGLRLKTLEDVFAYAEAEGGRAAVGRFGVVGAADARFAPDLLTKYFAETGFGAPDLGGETGGAGIGRCQVGLE